jgi:hypothetical protein
VPFPISPASTTVVALHTIKKGEHIIVDGSIINLEEQIDLCGKIAISIIPKNSYIIKYGSLLDMQQVISI